MDAAGKRLVAQTMQYVQDHFPRVTLQEAAAAAYVAPSYLSRVFARETQEHFTAYVLRYKMQRAKELLADPETKIYEIALAVGYADTSHFSKAFKKLEGCSPVVYRKRLKDQET